MSYTGDGISRDEIGSDGVDAALRGTRIERRKSTVRTFQTIGTLAGHTESRISLNHLWDRTGGPRSLVDAMDL